MYTIDATNIVPGRIATQVAAHLIGKHRPDYEAHVDYGDEVTVTNIAQMKLTKKRLEQKVYYQHSRYPGGLKTKLAKDMKPEEILWKAVHNMLPKNKLRSKRIKRLTIQ